MKRKDNITIGSSLAALDFAAIYNTKIVLNDLSFPKAYISEEIRNKWGKTYIELMLKGNVIGGDTVKAIQLAEEQKIVVASGNNTINVREYENLYVFSDNDVLGLPSISKENCEYKVLDLMRSKSLSFGEGHQLLETSEKFVKELHILRNYLSEAISLYACSCLSKEQLNDFNFSDTMVKFKSEEMLEKAGYVGSLVAKNKRKPLELQTVNRIIQKKMDIYEDTDKIKFFYE